MLKIKRDLLFKSYLLGHKFERSARTLTALKSEDQLRFNDVGVQMLNETYRQYLFGPLKSRDEEPVLKAIEHLKKFDLYGKKVDVIKDVDNLELPSLRGKDLEEHFMNIARAQTRKYMKLLSSFASRPLPKMPEKFEFSAGWTKYNISTGTITKVEYPEDDVLVFDVETLVLYQNCPAMAVAVSSDSWYSWCNQRLIDDNFAYLSSLKLSDLIPFESSDPEKRKSHKRMVIGHNVGFDRSFIKEQYYFEKSALRFLDTMSMHIACSGFTSEQRTKILTNNKDEIGIYNYDEFIKVGKEKPKFQRTSKPSFQWRYQGSLNNLNDVHQFYCPESTLRLDKDTRNLFVKGTSKDILDNFDLLIKYCANDVLATFEAFKELYEIYLARFPHPVTFSGMLEMGTMYLPINKNWQRFVDNCQNSFDDAQYMLKNLLVKSANQACEFIDEKDTDPWLFDLDWKTKNLALLKGHEKELNGEVGDSKRTRATVKFSDITFPDTDDNSNTLLKIASEKEKRQINEMKALVDSNPAINSVSGSSKWVPKNLQHLYNYPNWYRELCPKLKDPDWQPGPALITTKVRVTPNILRLTWDGYPLYYHDKYGWGYLITEAQYAEYLAKTEKLVAKKEEQKEEKPTKKGKKASKKAAAPKTPESMVKDEIRVNNNIFKRIPHKDGDDNNVGNPLSKSFVTKINEGVLSSIPKRSAGLSLKFNTSISYWENNEKRIRSQKAIWLNEEGDEKVGAILPITTVAGTITRRAVEPTWLTASNFKKDRIGGELKTMIQSPKGYVFVGADVDSQELWIASTIGDAHFANMHGSTALGWMNLQGKKADGTDMHSKTASMIGISRDQAKIFNYGRIYGAGRAFAEKLLMQFDSTLSEEEAKSKAKIMFDGTKGKKVSLKSLRKRDAESKEVQAEQAVSDEKLLQLVEDSSSAADQQSDSEKIWVDGTESEMFNKLEQIAKSPLPKTPVLDATITRSLEPINVSDDFMTSRINWVVQSSAVDYLHIMLVCMNWLIDEYKIDARFSISIHDEVRYIVKEEDKYRAALALQITNLLTRSLFAYKLGFDDLPMNSFELLKSVAFFSGVDIDKCLRKEPDLEFVTPSNPNGLSKGYDIPKGVCMDIYQIIEKTKGSLEPQTAGSK